MPVLNNYNLIEYHGNSNGRTFNFPFRCYSLDHLIVEYTTEDGITRELIQHTEYSISGGLDNNGGSITFPLTPETPPITENESIRIYRSTPMSQEIDYPVYQQTIENALDKSAMVLQEVATGAAGAQQAISDFATRVTEVEGITATTVSTVESANATSNTALTTARLASGNASIAINTAEDAETKADQAVATSNLANDNADYAVDKAIEAKTLIDSAVATSNTAADNAATSLTTANTAKETADSALSKSETAITDSASALATASNMQSSVDAARIASEEASSAALSAIAAAEDSTHGHLNKGTLDRLSYNSTTGSFSVDSTILAHADLGNVDTSNLALIDGSNIDIAAFQDRFNFTDLANTSGSNIETAAYKALLGLPENTVSELTAINTNITDRISAINKHVTLTEQDTVELDWSLGSHFTLDLHGNRTLKNPVNGSTGKKVLRIRQDSTGSRTLDFDGRYVFAGGVKPTLSTDPNKSDIFLIERFNDGTFYTTLLLKGCDLPAVPRLALSNYSLAASAVQTYSPSPQTFDVINSGELLLNFAITEDCDWLSIDTTSGSTTDNQTITITYNTSTLDIGEYSATITVISDNGDNAPQTLDIDLRITEVPDATINTNVSSITTGVFEGNNAENISFTLTNTGGFGSKLDYSISADQPWLSIATTNGILDDNETQTLNITFNVSAFTAGIHNANITITADSCTNSPITIPVTLEVFTGFENITVGNSVNFDSSNSIDSLTMCRMNPTKALVCYRRSSETYIRCRLINISGSSISLGTEISLSVDAYGALYLAIHMTRISDTQAIVGYTSATGGFGQCNVITISGSSLSNSWARLDGNYVTGVSITRMNNNKAIAILAWDNNVEGKVLTLSGNSISVSSRYTVGSGGSVRYMGVDYINETKALAIWRDKSTGYGKCSILTMTGSNTVTHGTIYTFTSYTIRHAQAQSPVIVLSETKAIVCYINDGNSFCYCKVLTFNSSTGEIITGNDITVTNRSTRYISCAKISENQLLLCYQDDGNGDYATSKILTLTGTTVKISNPTIFKSSTTTYISAGAAEANQSLVSYRNSSYGTMTLLSLN